MKALGSLTSLKMITLFSQDTAMMKKLFLAAQLLLGLGLTSCGQEDVPLTHQQSTTAERITLSVDFASEAESAPRAMTVSSGGIVLMPNRENLDYNYMRYRLDDSLTQLGLTKPFNISADEAKPMMWFEEEVFSNELDDFFAKRPTAYTKHDKSISENDLF